jgi:LacI family repressor for deo operon, udp, cdd, tsx, nupC, and nupG
MPAPEVNMADVARRAGVSIATVSRALRGLPGVSDRTRTRIREIADELAYVVSPEASGLSGGSRRRVAVVLPRTDLWFYGAMLSSMEEVLSHAGLDVLVYQVDGVRQRTRFFQHLPSRRKVDAVVLTALPLLDEEARRLDLLGVQVVVAGGRILDYPHVNVDDHLIGSTAVRHLLDLGHRRIAMIRTSDTEGAHWSSDAERARGYADELAAAGVDRDPSLMVTVPFGPLAGAEAMEQLLALDAPPTAVFAYSDELAVAAISLLTRRGLRVPEDISVMGVDAHPLAQLFGLTTVDQHVAEQGHAAAEMVLGLLEDPATTPTARVIGSRLLVRQTTGRVPAVSARV